MELEDIMNLVGNGAFPMIVALYSLLKINTTLEKLDKNISIFNERFYNLECAKKNNEK